MPAWPPIPSDRSCRSSTSAAQADLSSAQARLTKAHQDYDRAILLEKSGAGSSARTEQTKADLDQASAAVARADAAERQSVEQRKALVIERESLVAQSRQAEADVTLADIDLEATVIRAPIDGIVGERQVRVGQYVRPGAQLIAVVPITGLWIVANFKEGQLGEIAEGDPVTATVDALGGARISGRVERFSPASGADFALIPPDNATANFTKIARRYGVRIAIEAGDPLTPRLRPGMSVEVLVGRKPANTASRAP